MKLHTLPKSTSKKAKRLGLGYGSGSGGHTVGRGQKGQKARGKLPLSFVGSSWVWFKRLPFMRGKSLFRTIDKKNTVTLTDLNGFPKGSVITAELLTQKGYGRKGQPNTQYKIVNSGKLETALTVKVQATKQAAIKITQAGGEYQGETA
jgi:large subunit ribosomal protein L15